jgi:pimeloyl-ACP methyl ester carboxylesterase/dienelactone hydrolase
MYTNRYPHMLHDWYVARVREVVGERRQRIAALRSRRDAAAYVRRCRAAVWRCFAPIPERTPLNAVVTGCDDYGRYRLEKVLFESRPGFLVTGNLYVPRGLGNGDRHRSGEKRAASEPVPISGPRPGVLGLCGHALDGKACDVYQVFAQGLVGKGFVVFMIDPIDQGERAQYAPAEGGRRAADGRAACLNCDGHNFAGNAMTLVGDFFGTWRAWDAIRGLDYLLSRPEVDRSRVGVTGNSGGGTLTSYVTALDARPTMAAPGCFICSYQSNLECELPSDAEQNPPGILAAGLDQADLLLCHAPRPTLVLGQYDDFFSEAFARQAAEDVRRVYRLLGAEGNVECFIGPRGHGYHIENRKAMYGFFLKHAGLEGTAREGSVRKAAEADLFVTEHGETRRAGSRRAFEFTAETARAMARTRPALSERQLLATARRLLGLPPATPPTAGGAPEYRAVMHSRNFDPLPGQRFQFAVLTEPGIQVILTTFGGDHPMMHPPTGDVTLYVGHTSGQEDVARLPELRKLARGRRPLVVVDPRGLGQSRPQTCGSKDFFDPYGSDYLYAAQGEMLAQPLLGRRVFDVLAVMDLLLAKGARRIDLLGRGLGSVIVAFAALLHPSCPKVRFLDYLPSYELLATTPIAIWPLSSLLRNVLTHFDLPDVYKALGRRLTKARPWNAKMRPAAIGGK